MKKISVISTTVIVCFALLLALGFTTPLEAEKQGTISFDTVTLDTGVTLEYAERGHGKGKVIIFIHGYTDSWFSFSSVLENLPPQYHGYALTQRGHGDSEKPLAGYTMFDFSEDIRAFMDKFDIHKAYIVGHSMGSVVAQRFAIDHPDRVKKLVLIGSVANVIENEAVVGFLEYVLTLEEPLDPAFVYDFQASTLYNPIPEEFLNTVVNESMKVPVRVWKAALSGMVVDHTGELPLITAPTLLVWGDKDGLFLWEDQLDLDQGIPDSTLLVYADTGHGVHWEWPVRFANDLVEFLH